MQGAETDLFQQGESDTGTQELAKVCFGEGTKRTDHKLLDLGAILFWTAWRVGYSGGRKVRGVDGVVDGYGDLEFRVVVYGATSDAGPYGLRGVSRGTGDSERHTVRLANVEVTLGRCFVDTTEESLRRTAAEETDWKNWLGWEDAMG